MRPVVEKARRLGPLPYSQRGRFPASAGPEPEAAAEWIAEAIDRWWYEGGRPDPYPVVEVGAGDGTRAARVLGLGPECLDALRYILVEPDGLLSHSRELPIEAPAFLFPSGPGDPGDTEDIPLPETGIGPLVTSLSDMPRLSGMAAVFAVDWVSRLPADRAEWHGGQWFEVRLAAEGDGLVDVLVPLEPGRRAALDALVGAPAEGGRYALLVGAREWLGSALRTAGTGVLAVVDRWTERTAPQDREGTPVIALDQLSGLRRPLHPAPAPLSWGRAEVTWRLG